jgi:hypothetical protein
VAEPLIDIQIAVWANPTLAIFSVRTDAGLNRVRDSSLKLFAAIAHPCI